LLEVKRSEAYIIELFIYYFYLLLLLSYYLVIILYILQKFMGFITFEHFEFPKMRKYLKIKNW